MNYNKCNRCITDRNLCVGCKDNPAYRVVPNISFYKEYEPVCPFGMTDCVCDPGYINFYYPDWYKEMYDEMTPKQAVEKHCGKYKTPADCYDDEDK